MVALTRMIPSFEYFTALERRLSKTYWYLLWSNLSFGGRVYRKSVSQTICKSFCFVVYEIRLIISLIVCAGDPIVGWATKLPFSIILWSSISLACNISIWLETNRICTTSLTCGWSLTYLSRRSHIWMLAFKGASISWWTVVFNVLSSLFVSSCFFSRLYVVISVKFITELSLSSINKSERLIIRVLEPLPTSSLMMQDSTRSSLSFDIKRSYLNDTSSFVLLSFYWWRFSRESLITKCSNRGKSIGLRSIGVNYSKLSGSSCASMTLKFSSSRLFTLLNKKFSLLPSPS